MHESQGLQLGRFKMFSVIKTSNYTESANNNKFRLSIGFEKRIPGKKIPNILISTRTPKYKLNLQRKIIACALT